MKLITKQLLKRFAEVGSQELVNDPIIIAKFFNPTGAGTWFASEYNPDTKIFFGYVTLFGLPCSCMGGSLNLPRGLSFSLDGVMFLGAWTVLNRYPAHPVSFKRCIWFFGFLFIIGFMLSVIYYNYQT